MSFGALMSGFAGAGGLSPDTWAKGAANFKGGKGLGGGIGKMFGFGGGGPATPEGVLGGQGNVMDLVAQQQAPQAAAGGGGLGGMFDKWKGSMTDNKGLFQGGAGGDMFGRLKEAVGTKEYKAGRNLGAAQDFAQSFDPQDTDSVKKMQEKMNAAGAGLKVDGIMGPKTLGALRSIQGQGGATQGPASQAGAAMQQNAADTQQAQNVSNLIGINLPGQAGGVPAVTPQSGFAPQTPAAPQQDPYGYGVPSGYGIYGGGNAGPQY